MKFSSADHMLGQKTSFNKFKKIEIMPSIFSAHNGMKVETNHKRKTGKFMNIWKLLYLMSEFNKVSGYEINIQKSVTFLYFFLLCIKCFIIIITVHLTILIAISSSLYRWYIFIYVKQEVWSIFTWFPSAISRLLSFTLLSRN